MFRLLPVLLVVLSACGSPVDLLVEDAVVPDLVGNNTALYFSVTNSAAEPDTLIGVATSAGRAVLHETVMEDGLMVMRPAGEVTVPANGTILFEPGGLHVMILDVVPLEVGQSVPVTLVWKSAGELTIEARVVPPEELLP